MIQSPRRRPAGASGLWLASPRLASAVLVILSGFWLGSTLFISFAGSRSAAAELPTEADGFRRRLSATSCARYGDIVQAASERGRQLSQAQLLWVAALVQEQALARERPARVLVFGYDLLSDALADVNCLGRTVFLESSLPQIDALRGNHPFLEVHLVHYKGKAEEADVFLASPWLIDAPPEVDSECFDVMLIDGPPGTGASGQPARLESTYYALQKARRCIEEGKLEDVIVLLHDAQRPMEQRIAKHMLLAPDLGGGTAVQALGTVKDGNMGDMAAFRVASSRPSQGGEKARLQAAGKGRSGAAIFLKYRFN